VFTVRPATPSSIAETFYIKMAHFERVPVQCYCDCIFSAVVANLPRQKKMGESLATALRSICEEYQ
jgi:predicted adenine nucleotide alpha hydrolase (AANH) superfamily ATPase